MREVLERRVEVLLDHRAHAVDLVHEQDAARRQVREQPGQVAGALDDRARGVRDLDARARARGSTASVVLPSPGGPWKSTWSSASPRRRAASMKMRSCSLSPRLPDELVERQRAEPLLLLEVLGQRRGVGDAVAGRHGCGVGRAARARAHGCSLPGVTGLPSRASARRTSCSSVGSSVGPGGPAHGLLRLRRSVPEAGERRDGVAPALASAAARRPRGRGLRARRRGQRLELVAQLDHQPLGGLLADAGHAGEQPHLLLADGAPQRLRASARRARRARAGGPRRSRDHQVEELELLRLGEAEEQERVLAHDLARAQEHGLARGRQARRACGSRPGPGSPRRPPRSRRRPALLEQRAAQRGDHRRARPCEQRLEALRRGRHGPRRLAAARALQVADRGRRARRRRRAAGRPSGRAGGAP